MAKEYKTPGVFIQEINSFPNSIAQVETAIPAFIGYTHMAKKTLDDDLNFVPFRINSLLEFEQYYGRMHSEKVVLTIHDTLEKNGTATKLSDRKIEASVPAYSANIFWYQMQLYFANGSGACYIVSTGRQTGTILPNDLLLGLQAVKNLSGVTLLVFPVGGAISNPAEL